jgi:hypothetical protein
MKKISFAIFLVIFFIAIPILFKVYAARLTPIEDIMSNSLVSQTSNNNIIFTASSGIPADGSVTITFPPSFSSVSTTSATSNLSGSTFSVSGNTVTITTTTSAENPGFQVNIDGIYAVNPSSPSTDTNQYIIDVSDSSGDTAGVGVVILSSSSVQLSVNVQPYITFGVSSNNIDLGLISYQSPVEQSNSLSLTTNSQNGANISVEDEYGGLLLLPFPGNDIYYQSITINNSSNTNTLTNYPVEVTMNTQQLIASGQMENTCGDIRITDSSGNELSYWVNNCNTTNTEIWVKIPSIPASSNINIDLYYGNLNLPSLSSGNSVFPYFDQGNSIANWTISGTAGQSTTVGNPAPSYYADGSTGDYMYINANVSENEVITFNVNTSVLGDFFFLTNSSGAGQMFRLDGRGGSPSGFATTSSWTNWNAPSSSTYLTTNTWYKFSIIMAGSQASLYYNTTTGDNPNNFGTFIGTYTVTNNGGYIGLVGDAGTGVTYWDNIIARPYSNPEPTVTLSSYVVNSSNQYVIKSSTGTITNGNQNYGINATGTNINILSPFNSSGFSVGGLLNTQTQILAQTSLPEQNATVAVNYIASASVTTPAGEYIDNVTYIATGNF